MPLSSMTIEDISDREFLLVVLDHMEDDGWTDSQLVADAFGITRRYPATRLAWLQRYGAVEREFERDEAGNIRYHRNGRERKTQRWRLTPIGEALANGKLKAAQQRLFEDLSDEQMLLATRHIGSRLRHSHDATVSKLMGREWRYSTSALRNGDGP